MTNKLETVTIRLEEAKETRVEQPASRRGSRPCWVAIHINLRATFNNYVHRKHNRTIHAIFLQ